MSLINEALKKAQRQRATAATPGETPEAASPATAAGAPVPRIAKRRPPMPARTLMLLLVGGSLLLVMGGILTFVLLTIDENPITATHKTRKHPVAGAPALAPSPGAVSVPGDAHPSLPSVQFSAINPAPAPARPAEIVTPPAPPELSPVVVIPLLHPAPPGEAPPPPKPVPNPAVPLFLDSLRVTGVRESGSDSKVIMNDHIVRLNDYVDRTLGLRLTRITSNNLGFTDDAGFEYTKNL